MSIQQAIYTGNEQYPVDVIDYAKITAEVETANAIAAVEELTKGKS